MKRYLLPTLSIALAALLCGQATITSQVEFWQEQPLRVGLSDYRGARAEDGRQRSADHRLSPGIRLGREIRGGVDARGGARCRVDGQDFDQGFRAGGDGPPRRLDHGRVRTRRGESQGDAPHVLLFPEIAFDEAAFLARVDASERKHGYCAIGVSEGLHDRDGKFLPKSVSRRLRPRAAGRRGADDRRPREARAEAQISLGRRGLPAALGAPHRLEDRRRASPTRSARRRWSSPSRATERRDADDRAPVLKPYRWEIGVAPLRTWPTREKKMPRDFITPDGFHITRKCRRYLEPLIAGEAYPPYGNGLPSYVGCATWRCGRPAVAI